MVSEAAMTPKTASAVGSFVGAEAKASAGATSAKTANAMSCTRENMPRAYRPSAGPGDIVTGRSPKLMMISSIEGALP